MAIKRLNYFQGQFLHAQDFIDEQNYHIESLQYHNNYLHTWGVAGGLEVEGSDRKITVRKGLAVDSEGRQIILDTDRVIDLAAFPSTLKTRYITIAYHDENTDPVNETGVDGRKRKTEEPAIECKDVKPQDQLAALILAEVTLNNDLMVERIDNTTLRKNAGIIAGDLEVKSVTFPPLKNPVKIERTSGNDLRIFGSQATAAGLHVSGPLSTAAGLHVGGDSDPGGKNLQVDGDCVINGKLDVKGIIESSVMSMADGRLAVSGPMGIKVPFKTKDGSPGHQLVWLMKAGEGEHLEMGDLVAIDSDFQVKKSNKDTKVSLVFGIVIDKEQAAVLIGDPGEENMVPVARMGIVKAKVVVERTNPITVGDYLKNSTDDQGCLIKRDIERKDAVAVALEKAPAKNKDKDTAMISVLLTL
jgi:hypothetical protein